MGVWYDEVQERRTEKAAEHCHHGSSPLSFSRQLYPEGCCDVLLDSVSSSQDSKFTDEEAVVSVTKLTGPQEVCMAWHGVEACVCRGRGGECLCHQHGQQRIDPCGGRRQSVRFNTTQSP